MSMKMGIHAIVHLLAGFGVSAGMIWLVWRALLYLFDKTDSVQWGAPIALIVSSIILLIINFTFLFMGRD